MNAFNSSPYKGSANITKEQFLFYEMRTVAKLLSEERDEKKVEDKIVEDNLFQYPTEKSVRSIAKTCIKRLIGLHDDDLIKLIATQPSENAKQICLYAMMKQYRIVWDFMITVIGEKYRIQDFSFGLMDVNVFLLRLQEQDDSVAKWTEGTTKKVRQILIKILVENEYLDDIRSNRINPVWLNPILKESIKNNNDDIALVAFNCFD